jgi:hypothetical protein
MDSQHLNQKFLLHLPFFDATDVLSDWLWHFKNMLLFLDWIWLAKHCTGSSSTTTGVDPPDRNIGIQNSSILLEESKQMKHFSQITEELKGLGEVQTTRSFETLLLLKYQ